MTIGGLGARRARRRPALLLLVFGIALVLVGVTASALVAVTGEHLTRTALRSAVAVDAQLVEGFVNDALRTGDIDADGPTAARKATIERAMQAIVRPDAIIGLELRALDGDRLAAVGPAATTPFAPAVAAQPLAEVVNTDDGQTRIEEVLPIIDADGEVSAVVALVRDATGLVAAIDAARRDVMLATLVAGALLGVLLFGVFRAAQARLSRQQAQLVEATRRDALTGMLNHGSVVALLADLVEHARRDATTIGVALVDIDSFRLLNDTHGHAAGDEVLLEVAGLVAGEAGPDAHVARYGPDEFIILRAGAGVGELDDAVARLRASVRGLTVQFGESEPLPISVSAGIAAYPEHAASVTQLLTRAAIALAEAKASGGDMACTARVGEEERVVAGGFDVLQGLVLAVDTKDRYTKRHSEDVARYALYLARRIGLDEETQATVRVAGLLHDVGKIGIPDVLLRKPSKLTAEEYDIFNQHVVLGDAIVRDIPNADAVRAGIRHHHERWDGGGYVDGLAGEAIPLVARIISVADAFSAMTTTRPYRKALPVDEAIRRLRDAAGTQLEPRLVDAFVTGLETDASAPMPGDDAAAIWRPGLRVA